MSPSPSRPRDFVLHGGRRNQRDNVGSDGGSGSGSGGGAGISGGVGVDTIECEAERGPFSVTVREGDPPRPRVRKPVTTPEPAGESANQKMHRQMRYNARYLDLDDKFDVLFPDLPAGDNGSIFGQAWNWWQRQGGQDTRTQLWALGTFSVYYFPYQYLHWRNNKIRQTGWHQRN